MCGLGVVLCGMFLSADRGVGSESGTGDCPMQMWVLGFFCGFLDSP